MSDVLEVALMDREKAPAKQRSLEPRKKALALKRKAAKRNARLYRKNHRDRSLPLRP